MSFSASLPSSTEEDDLVTLPYFSFSASMPSTTEENDIVTLPMFSISASMPSTTEEDELRRAVVLQVLHIVGPQLTPNVHQLDDGDEGGAL